MRWILLVALATALSVPAAAQSAGTPHPGSAYVVSNGAGEPVRVTTYAARPDRSARLDRYRGVRVFRGAAMAAPVVRATPVLPVATSPDGRFTRRGGASFPLTR